MTSKCTTCSRDPQRVNSYCSECSYAECPHRRKAWSEREVFTTKCEMPLHPRCPWCGLRGVDFDESPRPSDYCHHDPADIQ